MIYDISLGMIYDISLGMLTAYQKIRFQFKSTIAIQAAH